MCLARSISGPGLCIDYNRMKSHWRKRQPYLGIPRDMRLPETFAPLGVSDPHLMRKQWQKKMR